VKRKTIAEMAVMTHALAKVPTTHDGGLNRPVISAVGHMKGEHARRGACAQMLEHGAFRLRLAFGFLVV
jgi:hypothetical protein